MGVQDQDMQTDSQRKCLVHEGLESLRQRLLDLTSRNKLISFEHTETNSLRVIDEVPDNLFNQLIDDKELIFKNVPEPTERQLVDRGYLSYDDTGEYVIHEYEIPDAVKWAQELGLNTNYSVPARAAKDSDKHHDNAIQTLLFPNELQAKLKKLYQKANLTIQETGTNILYIVFGFLRWYDIEQAKERLAPLFLVPVRLHKGYLDRKTGVYQYKLSYSGEDIITNLSLREKLKQDFGLELPNIVDETTPEKYFRQVRRLIKEPKPDWKIERYISIALLNFSKSLMYLDLDPDRWPEENNISEHPLVGRFLAGAEQDDNDTPGIYLEEHDIDSLDEAHEKYPLIYDADSSQHSALVDAVKGVNLVIEGPPGTGKSQTITNLIAAAMGDGKKVLFVAEKLAALEVVRRRLDAADLGMFCLELHSHKTRKRKVLDDIDARLKQMGKLRYADEIEEEIASYEECRDELKEYVQKVNSKWKNTGKTIHDIFMAAARYRGRFEGILEDLHPRNCVGNTCDSAKRKRDQRVVVAYRKTYEGLKRQLRMDGSLRDHPWYGVNNKELQPYDTKHVKQVLERWQESLLGLIECRQHLSGYLSTDAISVAKTRKDLEAFQDELESLPALEGNELLGLLGSLQGTYLKRGEYFLILFESIQEDYAELEKTAPLELLNNLDAVAIVYSACVKLRKMVGSQTSLSHVVNASRKLSEIKSKLDNLKKDVHLVKNALGEDAEQYIGFTEEGLTELTKIIDIANSVRPGLLKQRDDLFDDEELDDVLPKLKNELHTLRVQRDRLKSLFLLDQVESASNIDQMSAMLANGGVLRWLKKDWRMARKQLYNLAASRQIRYPILLSHLKSLADFARKREMMLANNTYKTLLGKHFKGEDTNAADLQALRDWYKLVRKEYGSGFGDRVALGEAVMNIPVDVVKGLRMLAEADIQGSIDDVLKELRSLSAVFVSCEELSSQHTDLQEKCEALAHLISELEQILTACKPFAGQPDQSIAEMVKQLDQLEALKKNVDHWDEIDICNSLFQGQVSLETGLGKDNHSELEKMRSTLSLARHIADNIEHEDLIQHIYRHPQRNTFDELDNYRQQLHHARDEENNAYKQYKALVALELKDWCAQSGYQINDLFNRNKKALDNAESLKNWVEYMRARDGMESIGSATIVKRVESGKLDSDDIDDAYNAGVFDKLAREILQEEPELAVFSGHSHQELQKQFREYDNKLKRLQCEYIAWKIDQNDVPYGCDAALVADKTELALLRHEIRKKKRHIPIRKLLERAGQALQELKPCFMMGPMSVAQYLTPGEIEFDLVIMDEASQIKPQEALGAIARGAQLVVVGDPKQLPPTIFFDQIVDDQEDPTTIDESESILDAAAGYFPMRRLRWHYRSQHESLIAFSNQMFYDNDLVLFPSPFNQSDDYGIRFHRLHEGCFANRRNMYEARQIAEAVRTHVQHHPDESLGIVAMNAEQRSQIESAIETLAIGDPVFSSQMEKNSKSDEPLFVKNLENVQGDERDVIFISMTYGPARPNERVPQRFGPINTAMGWRRLNVLFTRSKKRMHIFSSMSSNDIIADETSTRGVRALKDFLAFCETGVLHQSARPNARSPDSDFEIAVIDALQREGFECVPQVGVAGFFIDVGVLDPGRPGHFLAGIECDGATYHSAKSVRDRDRLRQDILERLGWKIHRIWSTDWFRNPQDTLQPIIDELNRLKTPVMESIEPAETDSIIASEPSGYDGVQAEHTQATEYAFTEGTLKEKLIDFDQNVIRQACPHTLESKRLLRPAILEALLVYQPSNREEFLESIPSFLRQATDPDEGRYLDDIFEIINASVVEPEEK